MDIWDNAEHLNTFTFNRWLKKPLYISFLFYCFSPKHKCHFYLCSYQHRTGGHRLPFLVPVTTASLRNLGPLCAIVLSYGKCGPLLTPSIHWVSCVRLPRPVFIFFTFCLHPPYRIFLTSTKSVQKRGWHYLSCWEDTQWQMHLRLFRNVLLRLCLVLPCGLSFGAVLNSQLSIRSAERSFFPPSKQRGTSINSKLSSLFNGHCLWQISLLQLEKRLKERL